MLMTDYIIQYEFSLCLIANAGLFIPQIIAILKAKSSKGVSLLTFAGFNIIQFFTMLHGLYIGDYLLAVGYFLSILTCGTVSFLIIYYNFIKKRGVHEK